ncbi:tetratricopeptide repeat protein [Foetidibacter luteolus]|uniref:tetratricopeptide repeat protein n=1 Tax=Foetidibacter luteolus TaxID=2608880 RepID=UPI00129B4FA4|nr:tetratricopeptide repeat protein [Foetidibacter luteolus]
MGKWQAEKVAKSTPGFLYRLLFFFTLTLFSIVPALAENVFDFNATCQQAYREITNLRLDNGQQLVNQARAQNPNNLIPDILDGYIDFFVLFFNEDPAEYKIRKPKYETRLDRIDDGSKNSPFFRFGKSVLYLQRAAVEIKFGQRWAAGWDFRRAFLLIKENRKKYPDFILNDFIYGSLQVGVGTIPNGYKWLASLFGMKGSIKQGKQVINNFLASNDAWAKLMFNEASFYYCYITNYILNKPEDAFAYIKEKKLDVVNNHLFTFMAANLAINNKQTEYAKNVILNRNKSPEYLKTWVWDMEMGFALINHLDTHEAIPYLQNYVSHFKGNFYVKDVYQKLSWCYYLQGNMTAAENTRKQLLVRGNTDTDADKKSQKDAKSGAWPNVTLLKARLLNDGGYHKEALAILYGKGINDFDSEADKLEFSYRAARIYDDLEYDDKAISMYQLAMRLGKNRTEYFAARAALQIGFIYERQGKKDMAISYYQQCLDMDDHDYKDSLDQKAKAGIQRCKGE